MLILSEQNNVLAKTKKSRLPITTLGVSFSFQPSIQDKNSIKNTLNYITRAVQSKLKEYFDSALIRRLSDRLEKTFSNLNYSSDRRSVAIILSPDEEKLFYLNFALKPRIFFNENISLLDFVADDYTKPKFYFLSLKNQNSTLFEYYNDRLHKVYEIQQETYFKETSSSLVERNLTVLRLMDPKNNRPVFVTGSSQKVNNFYHESDFSEIIFRTGQASATDISSQSEHWQSEFFRGKIMLAQRTNTLISNQEKVREALICQKDGLLLIDKHFKKQFLLSLKTNLFFNPMTPLMAQQIEKFLSRGNHIEITKAGLLEDFGGIVLIENKPNHTTTLPFYYANMKVANNGFLF